MMNKPLILRLWPLLLAAIALAMPVQIMMIYGHGIEEYSAVLSKLTITNWMVMMSLLVCGYFIFEASRWTHNAIRATIAMVAINNFFVAYWNIDFSPWAAVVATGAFAAIHIPLLRRQELTYLFNHPEKQWWRVAVRKELHVPVKLDGLHNLRLRVETFDISTSGMFVPLSDQDAAALEAEQVVHVCLTFNSVTQFRCDARVVRRTHSNGHYPSGVGLEFIDLTSEQISELRRHLRHKSNVEFARVREL